MDRDFEATVNPFSLFAKWFGEAEMAEPNDPNAMALATVDASGLPDVRMVLLKSFDERGFVFFTNADSTKGKELSANPKAALCLHWKSLGRQIRIRGDVMPATLEEADKYFATRARQSRIGAWASQQSRPLESRAALEEAAAKYAAKFGNGNIPRPDYWRGFRVVPIEIEFWENGEHRLHDRVRFMRKGDGWERTRLFP